uniref:ATP synthase subunit a n=1 Tax=Metschnikowia bicuspidata TaxID=27322 RepID=A0A896STX2_9ASCO|nr:ATP synthase F0 subunit 6 [Metschnikowia bicuspidata]QSD56435.1 ATP synthase F0 subunit 6 [Metschnikowia bicuspidata]
MMYSPLEQFEMRTLMTMNNSSMMSMTNYLVYLMLVLGMMSLYYNMMSESKMKSTRWGLSMLSMYDTVLNMVRSQVGPRGEMYFPFMFSLFNFILIANLMSMMPYSFAMSAQMVGMMALSLTLWLGLTMLGLNAHGLNFFSLFVPTGTPLALVPVLVLIETLSYSSKALSLGLRLSANIMAGHTLTLILGSLILGLMGSSLLGLILGFIPLTGVIAIVMTEFAISCIQAYVFCILFSGYLKDAMYLH